MTKREKQKILRKIEKAEAEYLIAESRISALTKYIQPYFDQEVSVCPSSEGAIITDDYGELGDVKSFINNLL